MMSCGSWAEFVEPLSAQNQLILPDMLDQGRSAKMTEPYDHSRHRYGWCTPCWTIWDSTKVCIAGISYGSEIGLEYAIEHQARRAPHALQRHCRHRSLAQRCRQGLESCRRATVSYYYTSIPSYTPPGFFIEHNDWMERRRELLLPIFSNQAFIQSMIRLTNSSSNYDVRDRLDRSPAPCSSSPASRTT